MDDGDWLDLNVGCPSKRVNAHGAGAALLLEPSKLLEMVHRMRAVHKVPLSLKTRVGYQSAEDYPNILKCLAKCPLDFVTIHARTRCGQYTEPVNWNYLRKAVQILPFSVLGNGEVWSADDALRMLEQTGVHGIMCGRGVIRDPFLFARICAKLTGSAPPFAGRGELLKLAAELARRYAQADSDRKEGVFKEFAGWLSKNPCMGRELFLGVKRLQTFSEILDALERLSVSSENKESLSRKYQGVREGRI